MFAKYFLESFKYRFILIAPIVLQPNCWLSMLPLLESRVRACPAHVLHLCFEHLIFSMCTCAQDRCVCTHRDTSMGGRDQRWMAQGQPWKVPRYLRKQQSTAVLTPNTFKKPSPQPLPACSTQTTSQCLLLYLSLKLQYYWEASGRLILLMPLKYTVERFLLLRHHHFKQLKCPTSPHCYHFFSIIRKSFHLSSNDNCIYLLPAITCLQDFYYPKCRKIC